MHAYIHTCHPSPLSSCCGGVKQRGWWLRGRWRCSIRTRWCKKLAWMWWEHLDCSLRKRGQKRGQRLQEQSQDGLREEPHIVKNLNNESQILTIYSRYGCVWEWQSFRWLWLLNSWKIQAMMGKISKNTSSLFHMCVLKTCIFVYNYKHVCYK